VSDCAPSFDLQRLLAFARQYLLESLSEEDILEVFEAMDSDCDGRVCSSDWVSFFDRVYEGRNSGSVIEVSSTAAVESVPEDVQPDFACTNSSLESASQAPLIAESHTADLHLQQRDVSEDLLSTLQQLQQQLALGAAQALHLHSASSEPAQLSSHGLPALQPAPQPSHPSRSSSA
jgi:hypothetical protein